LLSRASPLIDQRSTLGEESLPIFIVGKPGTSKTLTFSIED